MSGRERVKVAVVGGGCAGITTAWELPRPEHQGRYEVTLYQMGWRLGGKGASGRRAPSQRIEEHGLHLWMGFYENAFQLMREAYAELDRDPETCPIATWRDAFYPDPWVGLADRDPSGEWKSWLAHFPPGSGNPGDPLDAQSPFTVTGYLARTAALLATLLAAARRRRREVDGAAAGEDAEEPPTGGPPPLDGVLAAVDRLLRYGQLATMGALVEGARLLESAFRLLPGFPADLAARLIEAIGAGFRSQLDLAIETDDELRRIWEVVDLVLAILRGSIRFGLATDPRGFDAINEYDWREWLELNGASRRALDSAFLRGVYDLLFAYEDGDYERPRMAAGQALRGGLRMFFTYRGALFWKMRAGMGDVVFAPFYEALEKRGVKFEFFHRLRNVRLAPEEKLAPGERPYVSALEFDLQAKVKGGGEYRPLIDVLGVPCWPAEPDYGQLVKGPTLKREKRRFESPFEERIEGKKTLTVTRDFDVVVLGVAIGAVPIVCREFLERDSRWRDMVANVKTVGTQAFQLWMNEDMKQLGWQGPPVNLSGFVEPFDTWADMRQLIAAEDFATDPRSIAYFCNVLPSAATPPGKAGAEYVKEQRRVVRDNAIRFLDEEIRHLWPKAVGKSGRFRWSLLVDEKGKTGRGKDRFDTQFWTANVAPSERYVLSLPGSIKYRISPLDNTYDNFTIVGDWTDCGHNAGCVEAAVISGRLAAHLISKSPKLEDIVGYDHP